MNCSNCGKILEVTTGGYCCPYCGASVNFYNGTITTTYWKEKQ